MLPVSYPYQRLISQPFQKAQATALLLDNISGVTLAYSTRKLITAYSGNCLRLRRDSDNAESDFGFTGSPPVLDTAAITAWLSGANGFLATWYDQSGNADNFTQATAGNQFQYDAANFNSVPSAAVASGDSMAGPTMALPADMTMFIACQITAGRGVFTVRSGLLDGNGFSVDEGGNEKPILYGGNPSTFKRWAADTAWDDGNPRVYTLVEVGSAGSDIINAEFYKNGIAPSVDTSNDAGAAQESAFRIPGRSTNLVGHFGEVIVIKPQLPDADRQTVGTNIQAYWGA